METLTEPSTEQKTVSPDTTPVTDVVNVTPKKPKAKKNKKSTSKSTDASPRSLEQSPVKPQYPGLLYKDIPVPIPTEKSRNSIVSSHKDDDGTMIYEAFNEKLFEVIKMLTVKLPHMKTTYSAIEKTMRVYLDKDIRNGVKKWNACIKGYEDCLREYNETNAKYFYDNVHNIKLLNKLKIKENWQYFKKRDFELLWEVFSDLLTISDTTELVPAELMCAVQQMTLEMNRNGQLDNFDDPNIDVLGAVEMIMNVAHSKPKVREGMEKLTREVNEGSRRQPPTYRHMLEKISKFAQ